MANVRAPTIAIVISSSFTQLTWGTIAVSAAMYANGSAKTLCSILTRPRNDLTGFGTGAVVDDRHSPYSRHLESTLATTDGDMTISSGQPR